MSDRTERGGKPLLPQERRTQVPLHPNRWANVSSKCLKDKESGHKDQDGSRWVGDLTAERLLKPANPLPHDMSDLGPFVHSPWEALVWGENISI